MPTEMYTYTHKMLDQDCSEEAVQDGGTGRSWIYLFRDTTYLQLHMQKFPVKKTWKLAE